MEGNEQLAVIIPMLKKVGAGIRHERQDGATPCASFTVAGVAAGVVAASDVRDSWSAPS